MAISKFWLDVFGEMVDVEEVLDALRSFLTLKKGTRTLKIPIERALFEVYTTTPFIWSVSGKKYKTLEPNDLYYR
jgi:hypothetical protein